MKLLVGIWFVLSAEMGGKDITAAFANERMEITDTGYKIWSGNIVTDIGLLAFNEGAGELDIVGTTKAKRSSAFTKWKVIMWSYAIV